MEDDDETQSAKYLPDLCRRLWGRAAERLVYPGFSGSRRPAGALGVQLAPAFTPPWLYQRLVWGGI